MGGDETRVGGEFGHLNGECSGIGEGEGEGRVGGDGEEFSATSSIGGVPRARRRGNELGLTGAE